MQHLPAELAERAAEIVDRGFTALKFDPIPGPWRTFIDRDTEKRTVENVRAVRQAVGSKIDVLVEMHRRLAPMHSVRIARSIEQYEPYWYEEPVLAENIDALATVRGEINLPVVTGETLYTKFAFREVFEKQAADIINPDVCNVGGILELKEIAAMAEPYFVAVSPHNYNSTTVGLGATIQVSATISNFLITEYFVNFEEFAKSVMSSPFKVQNGYINLPKSPGLGVELNEESLAKYPYNIQSMKKYRQFNEELPH